MPYELKEGEILQVKYDRLFHDLINEKEMDTVEWIVMKLLDRPYHEVHGNVIVGNNHLVNSSIDNKQKFVDLIVYFKDTINVIELNNNASGSYIRNVLYAINAINNSYIEGNSYYNRKVRGILVNLNWYSTKGLLDTPDKTELIYEYPNYDKISKEDYLLKIININLEKYANRCYNGSSDKDVLWKLLTRNNKRDLHEITKNEKMLNNYYQRMNYLSQDKEYCRMMWDDRIDKHLREQDAYASGVANGLEEGIQKGSKQTKEELIQTFFKEGVSKDIISSATNLSIDEINKIIDNN